MFVCDFQIMREDLVVLTTIAKIHYMCTMLRGEALFQLDTLYVEFGSTTTTHLNRIILGYGTYFFLLIRYQSKSVQCDAK